MWGGGEAGIVTGAGTAVRDDARVVAVERVTDVVLGRATVVVVAIEEVVVGLVVVVLDV